MSKILLKDIISYKKGNAFKSTDYQKDGVAIVRVSDFENDTVNLNNLYYVSKEVADKNKNVILNKYDVVVTTVGASAGNFIRVPEMAEGYLLNQNAVRLRINSDEKFEKIYLFYALKYKKFTQYLLAGAQGSAQPSIVLDQILNAEIPYPKKDRRKYISEVLFTLDKKIQLNTQINQTLEQIAQTIFKSWFIDFDPVHAKANALASGQTAEQATQAAMAVISGKNTQELHRLQTANPEQYQQLWEIAEAFPSGVDEEGLPWGWEERYLKDVCNIVYGKGLPKNKLTEKGFYVFGANGVIGFYDSYTYEKPQVLIGCRGTVGQVTLSYPYSFVTNNSLVIEYENSCVSMYYLEKYLSNINLKEISSGSVQPQITIQNMSKVKILIPNIEILNFYSEKVKEIYDKRLHHFYENQSLSKVRDLLLPKLLSGEV
ncbi:restriction endonuclease subunit S [Glaesserella parasuis]|uniref:restriction endonuclease subunit S n=1 Tax=Glaesserella parasuis TaxID=738 RepID=UPI00135D3C5B|nr:restriction endonuclease subunit S [Glaesserella parasuis]MDG6239251.1 restriction endonuclease subunit S [Glaesserella parasuis]MWQ05925.1 restriction endonuclease subunit S [Glaesserella parasuis]MWQ80580.1 restriction endonuclease subunit S [Glaesserella parasuis]